MKLPWILIGASLALLPGLTFAVNYSERADVRQFIDQMCQTDGFSKDNLLQVFSRANYQQRVIDAISRPAERVLKWNKYQDIFLTRKRIVEGRQFLMDNRDALVRARKEFGVPPTIIASIIGVETLYGRRQGHFRVLDSLSTLAFDYPPRATFFRKQLRQFLLMTREEHRSPEAPLGSYAGAMGYGQFTPSSFREYAIDFDGDGVRDIWHDAADAIGSVANYLAQHGWQEGDPISVRTNEPVVIEGVFTKAVKPSRTMAELKLDGVVTALKVKDDTEVAPLIFEGKAGTEYWLGFHNFYVITRYNHSKLYAMAVYQLSEKLKQPAPATATTYW